jgi:hypothetical protein
MGFRRDYRCPTCGGYGVVSARVLDPYMLPSEAEGREQDPSPPPRSSLVHVGREVSKKSFERHLRNLAC